MKKLIALLVLTLTTAACSSAVSRNEADVYVRGTYHEGEVIAMPAPSAGNIVQDGAQYVICNPNGSLTFVTLRVSAFGEISDTDTGLNTGKAVCGAELDRLVDADILLGSVRSIAHDPYSAPEKIVANIRTAVPKR